MKIKAVFLVLLLSASQLMADDSLLSLGVKDAGKAFADTRTMSHLGQDSFQEYKLMLGDLNEKSVTYHDSVGDKLISALTMRGKDFNTGVVQQIEVTENGAVIRRAYKIPSVPEKIESKHLSISDGGGAGDRAVEIKRSWRDANGRTTLRQSFSDRSINGQSLRVLEESRITSGGLDSPQMDVRTQNLGNQSLAVSIIKSASHTERQRTLSSAWGNLKLTDVKGEIIGNQITPDGKVLTVQSSEGLEYTYHVDSNGKELTATSAGHPRPINIKDFLVETKTFKGRLEVAEEETAHGMTVKDPAPASGR